MESLQYHGSPEFFVTWIHCKIFQVALHRCILISIVDVSLYWVVRKVRAEFLVRGVRTGLNISERLKTNDMRTYRKMVLRHIWKKIWLRYVNFYQFYTAFEYGRKQSAFNAFLLGKEKH